jgi:hypothetical protein
MRNLVLLVAFIGAAFLSFGQNTEEKDIQYLHIQFHEIPSDEVKASWEKHGITLLEYIPEKIFTAKVKSVTVKTLEMSSLVASFDVQPDEIKLHPRLTGNGEFPTWAIDEDGDIRVNVILYDEADYAMASEILEQMGYGAWDGVKTDKIVSVRVPKQDLLKIAALDFVFRIDPASPDPVPLNHTGSTFIKSNMIASDHPQGLHYTGKGIVIGHQDDGDIEDDHPDWKGRVIHDSPPSIGDHGDHIAGTLMGAGNRDPRARGMAWEATNYYKSILGVPFASSLIGQMAVHYNRDSVLVTNTSYGYFVANVGYDTRTRTYDGQMLTYPGLTHVIAAGNSNGLFDWGYGAGRNWANIAGGYQMGKNVITVGNTNDTGGINGSSSRGPAQDGRIKPDICAKGTNVFSTTDLNPSGYVSFTGTSMACPMVTGALAQLYQAYQEIHNVTYPPTDLMKVILLNTAEDLGNTGPDFIYGWGNMNARRALEAIENQNYFLDSLQNNGTNNHSLTIPAGVSQVKIMVYWHDALPVISTGVKDLVNDLDLTVTDPANNQYLPYLLDLRPGFLQLAATTGRDRLNNMEQVVIDNPAAGTYDIEVDAFTIPQGQQRYWVSYEYIYDEIVVTYPNGGEKITPFENEIVRWEAIDHPDGFVIEYSVDSGAIWLNAGTANAQRRHFQWTVPGSVTSNALVRVRRNNGPSDVSDFTFSIMGTPQSIRFTEICLGRGLLEWDSMPSASEYIVYSLGDMYMEPFDTVTTASYVFTNLVPGEEYWFSVAAISPGGTCGQRGIATETVHTPKDTCYQDNIMIESLMAPQSTCFLTSQEAVTVRLFNVGTNVVPAGTQLPLAYQVNAAAPDTQRITLSIDWLPGNNFDFTFDSLLDASAVGTYAISVWATLPVDLNRKNDTLSVSVEKFTGITTYPYIEDFETWDLCGNVGRCNDVCKAATRNGWVQLDTDDQDFNITSSGTGTDGTGPATDSRPGTTGGKYIYTESGDNDDFCLRRDHEIVSPCFDLNSIANPTISFDYHMYGSSTGRIECLVSNNNGATWQVVWSQNGEVQSSSTDPWETARVSLASYTNDDVIIKFSARTGGGVTSDMALDAIIVYDDTCLSGVQLPLSEDFDAVATPALPVCWATADPVAVFTTPNCAGTVQNSLQLDGKIAAYAESPFVVLPTAAPDIKVAYDYRAGDDNTCGENPEGSDAVRVDYWDGSNWISAKRYDSSTPQVFTRDSFFVPVSALSGLFKIRFYMELGGGEGRDNFNFDNVTMEAVCAERREDIDVSICEDETYTLPGGTIVSAPGMYVDSFLTTNGCDSIIMTNLTQVTIDSVISWDGAVITSTSDASSYQWIDCITGEIVPGETSATFAPARSGSYSVLLTKGGCTDTSACINAIFVSNGETLGSYFRVYPNPSEDLFHIEVSRDAPAIQRVRVMDALGRVLLEEAQTGWRAKVNLSDQPDGYYFFEIESYEGREIVKLLKN